MKSYLLLFPFLVVQWPITAIVASFLASPAGGSKLNIFIVYILVVFSDLLTDSVAYVIGRYAKEWLTSRYPKTFSVAPERFRLLEEYFKAEGWETLAIGKISHSIGIPVMLAAGSARMPYSRFITVNTVVGLFKAALLVTLGYYYGRQAKIFVHYLGRAGVFFVAILAVLVAYFILTKKRRGKHR